MEKIENIEKLEDNLYKKGFPKEKSAEVLVAINEGKATVDEHGKLDCVIGHKAEVKGIAIGYDLHFKIDPSKSEIYLNGFDATSLNHPEGIRKHYFSSHTLITAAEAGRMLLYGTKVAVNKDLTKFDKDTKQSEKYNTWIRIDTDAADKDGVCPAKTYHENYFKKKPFNLEESLKDLHIPVQELENRFKFSDCVRDLKKAHLIEVTIFHNNEEQKGYLAVNPEIGQVDVYDASMKLIPRPGEELRVKEKEQSQKQEAPKPADDEKKKPEQQKVTPNWSKSNSNSQKKGVSR